MEDPRTAPPLSVAEAEGFFATGSDARSAAPGSEPGSLSQAPSIEAAPPSGFLVESVCGGWKLTLFEGGIEAGGGSFPHNGFDADIDAYSDAVEQGEAWVAGGAESPAVALNDCLFQGSPGGSRGAGAAGRIESLVGAGGPETQADGLAGVAEPSLRCGECGNFRHASPRHKAHCRYAGSNCPGCMYAAQEHIASCAMATQFKLPTDTCCAGVDLPGAVAPVHATDCPNPRPVARASVTYGSDVARPALASRGTVRAYVSLGELSVGVYGNYVQVSLNDRWTSYLLTPTLARELANLALLAASGIGVNGGAR